MISNIGGTLGLFCGMSILSVVEVLCWLGGCLCMRKQKRKEQVAGADERRI